MAELRLLVLVSLGKSPNAHILGEPAMVTVADLSWILMLEQRL